MSNIKEKHHYITRYYLENFTDNKGKVWTYRKHDPSKPFCNTPIETAAIKRLYHLEKNQNINAIEDYFSDEVEAPASNAFKSLLEMNLPGGIEREKLSLFFGMLMVRTPSYIKHLNTEQNKQLQIMCTILASSENFPNSYKKIYPTLSDEEIEKDQKSILKGELTPQIAKDDLLELMLQFGKIISSYLIKMKWMLIHTNREHPFITSDNFIHIYHPTIRQGFHKIGLGMPNVRVHIPISSNLSLMLCNSPSVQDNLIYHVEDPPKINGKKINIKELAKALNKKIFWSCDQYVFASSNSDELKRCFTNLLDREKLIELISNEKTSSMQHNVS